MIDATENPRFQEFMKLVDKHRTMGVRTNADTPDDAKVARSFGAEGIGLFRTEHMFYGEGSDEPLFVLRKMILCNTEEERADGRRRAVPLRQGRHQGHHGGHGRPAGHHPPAGPAAARVRAAGHGRPRPSWPRPWASSSATSSKRGEQLHETNPMMGHRGVRLGITYPEVTEMQIRAIFEAAAELIKAGKNAQARDHGPRHLRRRRAGRHQGDLRPRA